MQNRSLKSRLAFLQNLEPDQPAQLDAALLEDSAFLLIEQLKRDGYFKPRVVGNLLESGEKRRVEWAPPYSIQLEAGAVADKATFLLKPGMLSFYKNVRIRGVSAIDVEALQRYFIPGGVLFQTRRARVFTPENLDRRVGRVVQSLEAMGYREARLVDQEVEVDPETGAVDVALEFDQGARHYVGEVSFLKRQEGVANEEKIEIDSDTLLTREWEQTQRNRFRNDAFAAGYPEVRIALEKEPLPGESDEVARVFRVRIIADWGEPATLGKVRFKGDEATRRSTLRSRLDLQRGEPLDRLEIEEARRRLMGLGIYEHVAVDFEPEAGPERDVVYTLEPGLRRELKLLGGWGSYELARVGFNWEHRNPFGRAHRYEVDVKQSLKASRAELGYSIPRFYGSNVLLYSNIEYNYREEMTYTRTTQGASFGASYTAPGGLRLAAEYGFFQEDADRDNESGFETEESATVASVGLSVSYDRRDDVLAPRSGYNLYGEFKIANQWFGGSVDFQKLELGGSYHFPVTRSTLVHLGLRGGSIFTASGAERNIPFNERFFPGGENSVRGYQQGEASPLDPEGDLVGAESYAVFNLELEQRVYTNFSTVVFFDSTFTSREEFAKETERLHTLGLGLRYQTVVGPVRVEYGHNLNPREEDPEGTLHFSIGFPF